jgi:hypothetical protein
MVKNSTFISIFLNLVCKKRNLDGNPLVESNDIYTHALTLREMKISNVFHRVCSLQNMRTFEFCVSFVTGQSGILSEGQKYDNFKSMVGIKNGNKNFNRNSV